MWVELFGVPRLIFYGVSVPSLLRLLERRTQPGIFLHLPPPRIEGGTAAIKIGSPWLAWFATALAPADPNRHLPYPGPFARCGHGAVEVGALYWRREGSTMVHFIVAAVWLIKRRRCTSSYVDLVKKQVSTMAVVGRWQTAYYDRYSGLIRCSCCQSSYQWPIVRWRWPRLPLGSPNGAATTYTTWLCCVVGTKRRT